MAGKNQSIGFATALNALFLIQEIQKRAEVIEKHRRRSSGMPFGVKRIVFIPRSELERIRNLRRAAQE